MSDIEEIKKENEFLKKRLEELERPFNFDNATVIEMEVEDPDDDVKVAKVVKLNNYEFINGSMYQSLISRHFKEIEESIALRAMANRMAESIEEAVENGNASAFMIDSLKNWNNIILNK